MERKVVTIFIDECGETTLEKIGENIHITADNEEFDIFEKNIMYIVDKIKESLPDDCFYGPAHITYANRKVAVEIVDILKETLTFIRIYSDDKKVSESIYDEDGELRIVDGNEPDADSPSDIESFNNYIDEAIDWLLNG